MKIVLMSLLLLVSSAALADTTIVGLLTSPPEGSYKIQLADTTRPECQSAANVANCLIPGQVFNVGIHFTGGSVCGTARRFIREMPRAVGHAVMLTGVFATSEANFNVNVDSIQILN
jgi:hypothetical protein